MQKESDLMYVQGIMTKLAQEKERLLKLNYNFHMTSDEKIRDDISSDKNNITADDKEREQMSSDEKLEEIRKLRHPFKAFQYMSSEDKLEEICRTEEMISIYEEMMNPIRELTLSVENLYIPTCIGVLSHWPMFNFFKDWLCRMNQVLVWQHERRELNISLERFLMK